MAKPDLRKSVEDASFIEWAEIMTEFVSLDNVCVKYSGLPSYLPLQTPAEKLADSLLSKLPWVQKLVELFGTERIIWGSDWPVSNMNGASLNEGTWGVWRRTSEMLLEQCNVTSSQVEDIFHSNAERVYHL
jgi:predicted TIM-barrel fold metal-dependent hydrolase